MRAQDLHALVVHLRPYRETSALVQFFTRDQGRLVGVMKGLHRGRRTASVQPFQLGKLSCSGKSGLVTVTHFEATTAFDLTGDALSAGFYVLELISRGLAEHQAEPQVFDATVKVLQSLADGEPMAPRLRLFELTLLSELGYGLDFRFDSQTGESIDADGWYRWIDEQGLVRVEPELDRQNSTAVWPGRIFLAIAARDFSDGEVLRAARLLNQRALTPLIGAAPLISRALYSGNKQT